MTKPELDPRRRARRDWLFLIGPALLILGLTTLYPIGFALFLSLQEWNWGATRVFVGLQNFASILSKDTFWTALFNTFYFSIGAVTVELTLGLGLAVAINRLGFGAALIRTLLLLPLMVSGIAVALVWKILLDPTLGIVNYFLESIGIPGSAWFGAPGSAMPAVILVDTWWQTAFVFIILSAGLKSLPQEPYEAAELEGASAWQMFRHITLPLLKPVLITVIIFRTIDTLKVFDIVFGTTGGGPLQATEVAQTLAYRTAFKFLSFGESAVIMVVFSSIILCLCVVYLRIGEAD